MILTVAVLGMMQVPVDQIIDVIAVRHGFVAAAGAVGVAFIVAATIVVRSCGCWISRS